MIAASQLGGGWPRSCPCLQASWGSCLVSPLPTSAIRRLSQVAVTRCSGGARLLGFRLVSLRAACTLGTLSYIRTNTREQRPTPKPTHSSAFCPHTHISNFLSSHSLHPFIRPHPHTCPHQRDAFLALLLFEVHVLRRYAETSYLMHYPESEWDRGARGWLGVVGVVGVTVRRHVKGGAPCRPTLSTPTPSASGQEEYVPPALPGGIGGKGAGTGDAVRFGGGMASQVGDPVGQRLGV